MTDIAFLQHMNNQKPCKRPEPLISEFISRSRLMPPGTPFPGPVDLTLTPHAIEWMDNMSPYSPIQHQAIRKAAQIAATFATECIIGYWMKEMPTAIMYLSATQDLLEKWGTKRLEPMIDSIGMREKIIENAEATFGRKSRKTGDKTFSKQFAGGFLEMASAQSPASQRSDSIRVMIRDEIDGAPSQLTTGEGNWLNTSAARTKFWGDRKKITDLSTPTTFDLSNIDPLYMDGDRRHFMVKCPMCGKSQHLYWLPEDGNHGLRGDFKAGVLQNAYYMCEFCHDAIFDISKHKMFNSAIWEPTATSWSPLFRSYYINSLYSPPRTVSWKDYYTEWNKAKDSPDMMRGFTNLYGGMPYKETGMRPKIENVIELRSTYKSGEVPDNVLYITAGADIQRGKVKFEQMSDEDLEKEILTMQGNKKNLWTSGLPRIEVEILGSAEGYRTYSIQYKVFYGSTADPNGGAFLKLSDWIEETNLEFYHTSGHKKAVNRFFMDSGYNTNVVYDFCEQYPGFLPCKGDQELKENMDIKGDEIKNATFYPYKKSKIRETQNLVIVSTNHYKRKIYSNIKIPRVQSVEQRPRFMEFPRDYPDHYFAMLTNEELRTNGSFHAGGRPVEALDCRVYALCAADYCLDEWVASHREVLVKAGAPKEQAKVMFTHRKMIEKLKFTRWKELGR